MHRYAQAFAVLADQFTMAVRALHNLKVPQFIIQREQRKLRRQHTAARRSHYNADHIRNGLNGPRAVARRLRQIERGQLREANGLVR